VKTDIFETLYKNHYNEALLYTLSLCKSKEVAEDIVADAFVKAYLTLDGSKQGFKYWLLRVCKNRWINHVHKEQRISGTPIEDYNLPCETDDLTDKIIRDEKYRELYIGIMKLPQNYRDILTLHYFTELPIAKIAELQNKSQTNVKTMLFRAREKLKSILEDSDYEF
jgi:RNA polymerase sigma-70 factor (ECF subfamily)